MAEKPVKPTSKQPEQGRRLKDPDIKYQEIRKKRSGELVKVIAILSKSKSAEYTRLGRNLKRLEALSKQTAKLKEEVKKDSRLNIAALFDAEDSVVVRVVKTVSFMLQLSKKPAPVKSVNYKNVLNDLQKELTPKLNKRLQELIELHTTLQERAPSLKYIDMQSGEDSAEARVDEAVDNNLINRLNQKFENLADNYEDWGQEYDSELESLKDQL